MTLGLNNTKKCFYLIDETNELILLTPFFSKNFINAEPIIAPSEYLIAVLKVSELLIPKPMILGVFIGTYSSIFVASPILKYLKVSQKTLDKEENFSN